MAILRAFRALRPEPSTVAKVAAVPYDVVNRSEALELAQGNPASFLHVSRPEIDLPESLNPYSDTVYEQARTAFERLRKELPLVQEAEPSIYIYRLKMGAQVQTGIFATFSIDEYDRGTIKKHEKTRPDKEDDRTRHVLSLRSQTGPVFLTYKGKPAINEIVRTETGRAPLFDFTAPDGIMHTLWRVSDAQTLTRLFLEVPALYIADGHHRAASASRARTALREQNPRHQGDEDYNFFLAVAFPSEELKILPYHRVLKDLNGLTSADFLKKLGEVFEITPGASPDPTRGSFAMYLAGKWFGLKPKASLTQPATDLEKLDVSRLQTVVLSPILGVNDPRTDKRIDFVGGIRGTRELESLVDSSRAAVAFSLHPTSLDDLIRVSDAGEIMPPKSTWFEPKLRDGLLSHLI